MLKTFFSRQQFVNFLFAAREFLYKLFIVDFATYAADIYYSASGKLSPRARESNKELVAVALPEGSFKTFFVLAYYIFLILFIINFTG